jgi:hypothetical protein
MTIHRIHTCLTSYINKSIGYGRSSGANAVSPIITMIHILRNPNIHYPKTVPVLSQINSVHAIQYYSLRINFFPFSFPYQNPVCNPIIPRTPRSMSIYRYVTYTTILTITFGGVNCSKNIILC